VPVLAARGAGGPQRDPGFGAQTSRLGSVGSNRYDYWRVALRTWADAPVRGTGASGFQVAWLRDRPIPGGARDAHSLPLETLAELGLVGAALLAAAAGGVAVCARRVQAADPALAAGPAAALAAWALHASLDWDWEMPALTLVALSLAALLVARAEETPASRPAAPPAT
jgi:O-antigen ligase